MGHRCCGKQKVKRGLWSPEEDEKLTNYITAHGHGCWSSIPKLAGLQRCGKSCRLRWINYLRPDLKRGSFSAQEEEIIIDVHRILGNRWAQIAKHLPGRTDNEVKNFWNSCIKKKLISQGLDPKTHNLLSSHKRSSKNNYKPHQQQPMSPFSLIESPVSENQSLSQVWTMGGNNNGTMINFPCTSSSINFNNNGTVPIPSSSSCSSLMNNPCGFGDLEEDCCIWATDNIESFGEALEEEVQPPAVEEEKLQNCELVGMDNDVYKEIDASFGSSTTTTATTTTFNLDHFVESTLMSPMDIDLAWNFQSL